jgi:capsular polysaccharide biosynthesis protein
MTSPEKYQPVQIDAYRFGEGGADIDFVELSPPMQTMPLAPSFILGPMRTSDSMGMFSITGTGPAGYYVVRNAVVTLDGITLHRDKLLTSLITNFPEAHCLAMLRHLSEAVGNSEPRKIPGRAVLLTGPGYTTWGHWLVDFLPRLFLLERAGWEIDKLKWIITRQTPAFARELLHLLGIPESCLIEYDPSSEMIRVGELIIPTNLSAGTLMHPLFSEAVTWMKRRLHLVLISNVTQQPKIFLSRSSAAFQRMLGNRDVIETIARAARYTVVDPALLPVPEQLGLFYSATHVAGEYGSGLHTSIFSSVGTVVTCLRGPNHTAGVLQNGLAKACGHKIGYVFGEEMPSSPIEAYTIPGELFRQGLDFADMIV